MIYKYTELVLFKDGRVSVKEKRVCVKPMGFTLRIYWSDRFGDQFYMPSSFLSSGPNEINIANSHLHEGDLIGHIRDVDSVFVSIETIK